MFQGGVSFKLRLGFYYRRNSLIGTPNAEGTKIRGLYSVIENTVAFLAVTKSLWVPMRTVDVKKSSNDKLV